MTKHTDRPRRGQHTAAHGRTKKGPGGNAGPFSIPQKRANRVPAVYLHLVIDFPDLDVAGRALTAKALLVVPSERSDFWAVLDAHGRRNHAAV